MTDPFAAPAPIASAFASADSFRGRLCLIQPVKLERNVPNASDPSKTSDRITATVTTVDGLGPVQVFVQKVATGRFLEGNVHRGVWFSQQRLIGHLTDAAGNLLPMVLGTFDTYKPGQPAGKGNPWGLIAPTEEQKQTARNFLANQTIASAAAPAPAPAPAPAYQQAAPAPAYQQAAPAPAPAPAPVPAPAALPPNPFGSVWPAPALPPNPFAPQTAPVSGPPF